MLIFVSAQKIGAGFSVKAIKRSHIANPIMWKKKIWIWWAVMEVDGGKGRVGDGVVEVRFIWWAKVIKRMSG